MINEYIIVKEKTELCSDRSAFLKLLETNSKLSINDDLIRYDGKEVNFELSCEDSEDGKEIVFHLIIKSETKAEEDLNNLNCVARGIRKTIKETGHRFYFNTIWDETSQYYCEKSYPLLNTVENLMRKLIFQFMLKSIGSKWIDEAFPIRLKQKISETAKKNDVVDLLKDSLYHADFIQLIELLFERYTKIRSVSDLFKKLEEIEKIEELEKLRELRPQSNWERYFSDLIEFENLDETWRTLYDYRNTVAHNKLINKNDYQEIKKLTDLVKDKLIEALEKLGEIEIPEDEKEDISSFTSKSMEVSSLWSNQMNKDFIDAYEPVPGVGSLAFQSQRCNNCGKDIKLTAGKSLDGLCSDCRISSALNTGITLDKKCQECDKPIGHDFLFSIGNDLCSTCRIKRYGLSISSLNDITMLHEGDLKLTGSNFTGRCWSCGKELPAGSFDKHCGSCKKDNT